MQQIAFLGYVSTTCYAVGRKRAGHKSIFNDGGGGSPICCGVLRSETEHWSEMYHAGAVMDMCAKSEGVGRDRGLMAIVDPSERNGCA